MKKILTSKWHLLAFPFGLLLGLILLFNYNFRDFDAVASVTFLSLLAGYGWEVCQQRKIKTITDADYNYSVQDILVTTIAGFVGAILAILIF